MEMVEVELDVTERDWAELALKVGREVLIDAHGGWQWRYPRLVFLVDTIRTAVIGRSTYRRVYLISTRPLGEEEPPLPTVRGRLVTQECYVGPDAIAAWRLREGWA